MEGSRSTLILAHGAGTHMDHPHMLRLTHIALSAGLSVLRFLFPYRARGRSWPPDRKEVLLHAFADVLLARDAFLDSNRVLLGGHSLGGRIAVDLVAHDPAGRDVSGVLLSSYPLHPAKPTAAERLAALSVLPCPIFLMQGGRDTFGNFTQLRELLLGRCATDAFLEIPGGDHGWKTRKSDAMSAADVDHLLTSALARWLEESDPKRSLRRELT